MDTQRRYIPGAVVSKYLYGAAFSLLALGTATPSAQMLEEVVVTAQKRAQTANDLGMAVSAFSGDAMKELGVVDTTDLAALTPGFTFTDSGAGVPVYTLRGVGFNDRSYNAQSAVTVYVDEIAIPYPVMTQGALLDLERVEVLKGPQGTLYGRNTTGGAINYIGAKPTDELEAGILASYGRYDTYEVEAYAGGPLGDVVRGRAAVRTVQSREGWQENNLNSDELGEKDSTSLRLSLAADFTDSLSGLLQLNWWENQGDTQAPQFVKPAFQGADNAPVIAILEPWQAIAGGGDDPERAGWVPEQDFTFDMESTSLGLNLTYAINDTTDLVSLTGYSKFKDNGSRFDAAGFSGVPFAETETYMSFLDQMGGGGLTPFADAETYPWAPNQIFSNAAEIEFFSQELRLVGQTDHLNWVAGLYYSTDTNDNRTNQETVFSTNTNNLFATPFFSFLGVSTIVEQESDTIGAYVHTEWQLSDALRLTVGGRYSDDEIDFFGCSGDLGEGSLEALFFNATELAGAGLWFPPGFEGEDRCATLLTDANGDPFANGGVNDKLEEDSFSYKLGLDWFANEDVMFYGSYSRGFKAGGFPNIPANFDTQYEPTEQEQLDAFELGVKATLLDGAMQLNSSIYHYEYEDKQLFAARVVPIFGVLRTLTNVPDSTVDGAEIDLQWSPLEGLYLQLTGSYIDSEVEEYTGANVFGVITDFGGSPFPFTADLQANLVVNYEWSLSERLDAFVGFDASYTDDINTDFEPTAGSIDSDFVIDSYSLLNLRAGLASEDGRWRATAWSRNVTDEFYINNVRKFVDSVLQYTGVPRTYGITLEYNYF